MQYNPNEFEELLNIFKAESEEIIQKFNDRFMELEKNPQDKTPIKELFQLAHSLKGGARMIGFNSIQDIAHKLEDILSYWKDDNIKINTAFFPIIYKACDILFELIDKSVKQKSNYLDDSIVAFISKINEFIYHNTIIPISEKEKPLDFIVNKEMDINAILLELMFVLGKDNIETDFDESVQVLKENFENLAEIFAQTDYSEVKEQIKFLSNFVLKITNQKNDIDFLKQRIIELRSIIYNLYKDINVHSSEKKNVKKVKVQNSSNKIENQSKNLSNSDKSIIKNIDFILSNLQKIKTDKNYIKQISGHLKDILQITENSKIKTILTKIINVSDKINESDKAITNDCYMAILQSIFLVKLLSFNEREENESNYNSVIQRLAVVEDMYNESGITGTKSMDIVSATPIKVSNSDIKNINFNQAIKPIDLQEIKTLRVDTAKLDNLISQTGELLINGIKTREHIIELSKINNKLQKWGAVSKKILRYIKYLEKKGFFSSEFDDVISLFYKRTQHFFTDNAELINEINKDFSNLYNTISEDDNKLHQTAMEIEAIAKGIRVLPLATLFHSFPRMVRDIAKENNKKVDFIISGSDTTVDKKIIEEIKMPLIHILRNSISHGIECPAERLKFGKSETGTIRLTSRQEGNNVIISIEDDGYGVNIDKIKEKAVEKGLLTEEEISNIDPRQLIKLIFFPGFSTEEAVTEISGRGIGLDVVKTKITNLNGEIFIDSILNKGCRVTLRLPLSMSTIKTFILTVNNQKYAIPVNIIKYVTKISKDKIFDKNGKNFIIYDNHSIPIYSLASVLEEKSNDYSEQQTVIIIENHEKQVGYTVDKLIGAKEVFQKKLVAPIIRIKNISGFTLLPTGEVCLIINPYELIMNTD